MTPDTPRTRAAINNGWLIEGSSGASFAAKLEQQLAAEKAARDAAESSLASLADTVASALRNSNLPDSGITLSTDLRDYVWSLSYEANYQRQRAEAEKGARERAEKQAAEYYDLWLAVVAKQKAAERELAEERTRREMQFKAAELYKRERDELRAKLKAARELPYPTIWAGMGVGPHVTKADYDALRATLEGEK